MSNSKFKHQYDTCSITSDISISSKKSNNDFSIKKEKKTILYSGESVPKYHKIIVSLGSLDELISYIGVIKSEYMIIHENKVDIDNSTRLFVFARLTQIQETLIDIQQSIGSKKNIKFTNGEQRIRELENEISLMGDVDIHVIKLNLKDKPLQIIPGTSLIESKLLHARSICRRVERQMHLNEQKTNFIEENCLKYLNKLSDYLLGLSIHLLHMENKEPTKKVSKNILRNQQSNLK